MKGEMGSGAFFNSLDLCFLQLTGSQVSVGEVDLSGY